MSAILADFFPSTAIPCNNRKVGKTSKKNLSVCFDELLALNWLIHEIKHAKTLRF